MKSQISWVNWGQDESKVLVCWCSFSETVSKPDLQSCLLQGERGCSHCRNLFSPHQRKPHTRASVSTNLRRVLETRRNLTLITASSAPWAFLRRNLCCLILNTWKAERLSGSTLWAKGAHGLHFCSVRFILYRENNLFSLWKVWYLIKNLCTFLGFISIFIWIFTFHDVFKYFQGKVCSDNKIPGWLESFFSDSAFLLRKRFIT